MKYTQVRASDCAHWAIVLKDALREFDVIVHPTSDIGQMIAELEWLGTFPPDAPQPDSAWSTNPARARIAFPLCTSKRFGSPKRWRSPEACPGRASVWSN